jgi:hypothetical protein
MPAPPTKKVSGKDAKRFDSGGPFGYNGIDNFGDLTVRRSFERSPFQCALFVMLNVVPSDRRAPSHCIFGNRDMRSNRLTSAILIATCALFLQTGCEEEVAEPQQLSPDWFDRFHQQFEPRTASVPRTSSQKVARIVFEKSVHDFGTVAPLTVNSCEFSFKNTGDAVLKIAEVTESTHRVRAGH